MTVNPLNNRPYVSNGLNQLTRSGSVSLGYDARGNLTRSGTDTYRYTSQNLLTSAPGISQLRYDAMGRLLNYSQQRETRFAYDGDNIVRNYGDRCIKPKIDIHRNFVNPFLSHVFWYS